MQEITTDSPMRVNPQTGLTEILTFSITEPGWKAAMDFQEESMEIYPGQLACRDGGCKVYKYKHGETRVIWHNGVYGCPKGRR